MALGDRKTKIRGIQMFDDTIGESKLAIANSPVNGYFLRYDNVTSKFKWETGFNAVTEVPSGLINTSNLVYTLTNSPQAASIQLYLNGLYQEQGAGKDYTVSGSTINFLIAPDAGDTLIASYVNSAVTASTTVFEDANGDTKIEVEQIPNEDKIRMTTFGIERVVVDGTGVKLQNGTPVNEFSIDGTLVDNSDTAIPTEKAIKTYVDTSILAIPTSSSDSIVDADLNTKVEVEKNPNENIIRMTVNAVQKAQIDVTGMSMELGAAINEFSTDELLTGNSNIALPTERAVKQYVDSTKTSTIEVIFDGGGVALASGEILNLELPFSGSITEVSLLADQTGNIVIDILKDTYLNYPIVTNSITSLTKPTIVAGTKYKDGILTGWTTSFTAGDIIQFKIDSAATITRCTVSLKVTRN